LTLTPSTLKFARRFLDWNRMTFEFHAKGSQARDFDTQMGKALSSLIAGIREELNLTTVFGYVLSWPSAVHLI
jgi:hypothetical protein